MSKHIVWGAGTALLVLAGAGECSGTGEAEFAKALEKLERARGRDNWKGVRRKVDALLEEHREAAYVTVRVYDLIDDYRDAAFWEFARTRERATPERVVSGDLQSYKQQRDSAKLTILYGSFGRASDFAEEDGVLYHPAVLIGDFEVELQGCFAGRPTDGVPPLPLVHVLGEDRIWTVSIGTPLAEEEDEYSWYPARIREQGGVGGGKLLAEDDNNRLAFGQEFKIKISSDSRGLRLFCDGKPVTTGKTDEEPRGTLAVQDFPGLRSVRIKGKVSPAWIQGLINEADARQRSEFAAAWSPEESVPGWLMERFAEGGERDEHPFPDPTQESNKTWWDELAWHFTAEEATEGLAILDAREDPDALPTPAFEAYARALFLMLLGRSEEALKQAERAAVEAPHCRASEVLAAGLAANARRAQSVSKELLLGLCRPEELSVEDFELLATQFLRESRLRAARASIELGIRSGLAPRELAGIHELLSRAIDGPRWGNVFEWRTDHYLVRSDIDRATCYVVAQELEKAWRLYNRELVRKKKAEQRPEPYRVYIFSGEAGYQAHSEGLFGERAENTAGQYSPTLKQLLVWNVPDREGMLRTVRHEGLHQYLDSVLPDPPIWLNEGLAEYYETAETRKGSEVAGAPIGYHVSLLVSDEADWWPLDKFTSLTPAEFYADAGQTYAQAWALVHYLLHASPRIHMDFDRYIEELRDGPRGLDTFVHHFADGDAEGLEALQRAVQEHVANLR